MELTIPLIPEDFDPGNRVYFAYLGGINKGTVASLGIDEISVTMDDGQTGNIPMSAFVKGSGSEYWGRIPDIQLFEVGMTISRLNGDGGRRFAVINAIIPNREITVTDVTHPGNQQSRTFRTADGSDLENIFKDFEIEG